MKRRVSPILTLAVLVFFVSPAVPALTDEEKVQLSKERDEFTLAMHAKLLCSGCFVVGRDPEEFIKNDLQREGLGVAGWDEIEVDIDRARQSVTLSTPGVPSRTAIYTGSQGCVLLPLGETELHFEAVEVVSSLPDPASQLWPMGDALGDPSLPAEVSRYAMESALDFAFDDNALERAQQTRAMVVLYKGSIVGERYAPGFNRSTRHINWSMGKSITSALIGILVGDGEFKVDDPAPVPEWHGEGDGRSALTLSHLLHMSSGLRFHTGLPVDGLIYTSRDNHRFVYFGAPNVFDYSIQRDLEYAPNTVWRYRNCDPLSLGKVIRMTVEARGEEYLTFPQRALFDPIGMRNMVLETDPYGNFIMTGFEYGTARDWARFGLLHLRDGVWMGKRILPAGWVDFVQSPAPANKSRGYGALFWLNKGSRFKSLPGDMFWPAGYQGQVVMIIPSRDVVIVRLGHSYLGGFDPYIEKVVGKILGSIKTGDEKRSKGDR